jgi:hypothetical protein
MQITRHCVERKRDVPTSVRLRIDVGGTVACRCGCDVAIVQTTDAQRALVCESCGKYRGLLGDRSADFIAAVCAQFGAPETPITLRRRPQT